MVPIGHADGIVAARVREAFQRRTGSTPGYSPADLLGTVDEAARIAFFQARLHEEAPDLRKRLALARVTREDLVEGKRKVAANVMR